MCSVHKMSEMALRFALMQLKVLFILGTRPEAIKLCPVIRHVKLRSDEFDVRVCVTAQHREMLDQVLKAFDVIQDWDLDIMRPGQTLSQSTARIMSALEPILAEEHPNVVLVQGDTTTTFAAALASFYQRIPVGHIEAGLRTGDLGHPFPEELNRVLTTRLASLHFAPTDRAARRLRAEGVPPERVLVTGNTGIDALLYMRAKLEHGERDRQKTFPGLQGKRLILLTAHRRENFGEGLLSICEAVRRIAARGDVEIVYPIHPNPNVRNVVERELRGVASVRLLEPLDYVEFVDLMRNASIILTDSGGVQEEAPSLGVPVLVLRSKTERQEAIEAGTAQLVGTDPGTIVRNVNRILDLDGPKDYSRPNPFGDGHACERIADALMRFCRQESETAESDGLCTTCEQA